MTYKRLIRTVNEVAGNLNTPPNQAARELRKAARYAKKLARFLERAA